MRRTGRRSSTDPRRAAAIVAAVLLALLAPGGAAALDVFTLWQRAEAPLSLAVGDRVDYSSTTLEAGRRTTELVRVQCVGDGPDGWLLEILPLEATKRGFAPRPGEGLRLVLSHDVSRREGDLAGLVRRVEQWTDGRGRELDPAQWREDPLTASLLDADFRPDVVTSQGATTRVVGGADLLCSQFTLVAADTARITLPRGEMIQIHRREISAAVHPGVPFLGLAFAAERSETSAQLIPAGRRSPPPPTQKVETMELIGYGRDAAPALHGS
ncbi:MAG: hypothetical protein Q7W56_04855 [Candidatus Latescibacteria bacterium]|nr:hypothetical protein [Candidatus Latescibacterota bacterium]